MTAPTGNAQEQVPETPDETARIIRNFQYQARNYHAQGITPRDIWGGDDDA